MDFGGKSTLDPFRLALAEFVSLGTNFLVRWRDCKILMSLLLAIKPWITAYFVSQALIHHLLFPSIVVALAPRRSCRCAFSLVPFGFLCLRAFWQGLGPFELQDI